MNTLSLAPFQGITDVVYRNMFMKHFRGIDKYYTPFFTGIQKDNSRSLRGEEIDPRFNDVRIVVPQILSNTAEEIIRFANQCKSMGYSEFNLNMGCPFPRVANKTRGCGLMADPQRTIAMLEEVFKNIDGIKFSIKCRLGYYNSDEIFKFIDTFNSLPFSEIIIHPRIGKQMYTGEASLEKFIELLPLINKPLVYNGDIFTPEKYKSVISCKDVLPHISMSSNCKDVPPHVSMSSNCKDVPPHVSMSSNCKDVPPHVSMSSNCKDSTPHVSMSSNCKDVTPHVSMSSNCKDSTPHVPSSSSPATMLGRGLLTNPFLAEEIKQINENKKDKQTRLHDFVVNLYIERLRHAGGSPKIIGSMKELWKYMINIFDDPQNVWRNVKKVNHLDEYEEAVEKIFNEYKLTI